MLRFYNSTTKRDYNRFDSEEILSMPRQKFVPFQIKRSTATDDYVQSVNLVNQAGTSTDISAYFETSNELLTGWTNFTGPNDYDTFNVSATTISTAIEASDANIAYGYSNELDFTGKSGDVFYLQSTLTVNSGIAPDVYLASTAVVGVAVSNIVTLSSGVNKITLKLTSATAIMRLIVRTNANNAASFACTFSLKGSVRPHPIAKTDDYLPYFGGSLSTLLPLGVYSLKVSDNLNDYYSDWFCVSDIQPTLTIAWTTKTPPNGFNTLTYNATTHELVGVESGAEDPAVGYSTTIFTVVQGEEIYVSGCLKMTSGATPDMYIFDAADAYTAISNTETLDDGDNLLKFTITKGGTARVRIETAGNSSFSLIPIQVYRAYGDYVRITWENTNDIRDIASKADLLFSSGLTQEIFLDTYLNTPIHESNEIGQEKDGTFIAEKMTATPRQRIVAYVPRSTYEGLIPMPLCDTITVWDEVGNKYLVGGAADQATGNLEVNFDFTNFEIGTLEILFSESSYYWTENIDNVS